MKRTDKCAPKQVEAAFKESKSRCQVSAAAEKRLSGLIKGGGLRGMPSRKLTCLCPALPPEEVNFFGQRASPSNASSCVREAKIQVWVSALSGFAIITSRCGICR